jgi:hypothetical protein
VQRKKANNDESSKKENRSGGGLQESLQAISNNCQQDRYITQLTYIGTLIAKSWQESLTSQHSLVMIFKGVISNGLHLWMVGMDFSTEFPASFF